jgi:chorismate--pyruvate lyase
MPSERAELGCERRPWSFVREVYLYCGKVPCVFARTVIPAATLHGGQRRLLHLGSKPLGEVLFRDRKMERGKLEITGLVPGNTLYSRAQLHGISTHVLWGRRCVFWLGRAPLLVNEFFLPNLLEMLEMLEM